MGGTVCGALFTRLLHAFYSLLPSALTKIVLLALSYGGLWLGTQPPPHCFICRLSQVSRCPCQHGHPCVFIHYHVEHLDLLDCLAFSSEKFLPLSYHILTNASLTQWVKFKWGPLVPPVSNITHFSSFVSIPFNPKNPTPSIFLDPSPSTGSFKIQLRCFFP